jgi:DNA-binding CsgD family transcriptional regulator
MENVPHSRITDGQRACLRLVLRHMSSKDIARALGISRHTVDQRIKLAMRQLGASSRVDAALRLAQLESWEEYQGSVYQAPDIADPPPPGDSGASEDEVPRGGGEGFNQPARGKADPLAEMPSPQRSFPPIPLPIGGTRPGDLRPWQRLGWIAAIAMGIAITFAMFVTAAEGLSRMVRALQ